MAEENAFGVAGPLGAWTEIKRPEGARDAACILAVHAVPIDKAGVRGDSTLCGMEVVGEPEDCPFHATLTATRCINCSEQAELSRRGLVRTELQPMCNGQPTPLGTAPSSEAFNMRHL
jgi:hypothetical protein